MEQGKFIATQNHKGNVVVDVELAGKRPVSVPKQGRAEPQTLLQHHEKTVEVERSENGSFVLIRSGQTVLFSKDGASQQQATRPSAQVATISQPIQTNTPTQNQPSNAGVSLQTIEQERAKHALAAVKAWVDSEGASSQKELLSYVTGMPAMILMSGFGQTCAFYKAKGGNHERVLNALKDWLNHGDLMDFITQSSGQDYQLAQAESLVYLNWLKKFTKAYLKGEDDATTS